MLLLEIIRPPELQDKIFIAGLNNIKITPFKVIHNNETKPYRFLSVAYRLSRHSVGTYHSYNLRYSVSVV